MQLTLEKLHSTGSIFRNVDVKGKQIKNHYTMDDMRAKIIFLTNEVKGDKINKNAMDDEIVKIMFSTNEVSARQANYHSARDDNQGCHTSF